MKIIYILAAALSLLFLNASIAMAGGPAKSEVPTTGPYYEQLPPINLSVISKGSVTDHRTIIVVLEVKEFTDIEQVKHMTPLLQSELISYFHGVATKAMRGKLNDDEFVRGKIKQIANNVLGQGKVLDVLFKANQARVWS